MSAEKGRENTGALLGESLKRLMLSGASFEKITIKDVTDGAGLIRPTFYNHFRDKYELLEWIIFLDLAEPAQALLDVGLFREALRLILARIEKSGAFYRAAQRVEGQNGFEEILHRQMTCLLARYIQAVGRDRTDLSPLLTRDNIARYYAHGMCFVIEDWIRNAYAVPAEDIVGVYDLMVTHSVDQLLRASFGDEP